MNDPDERRVGLPGDEPTESWPARNEGAMTRVFVTGDAGKIGRYVSRALTEAGYDVVGFDLGSGGDVREAQAVRKAASGCDAVVHLAAIPDDSEGTPAEIMATNVFGTWNVLSAAEEADAKRVVYFSSIQATGLYQGHNDPEYLPLDDDHPSYARSAYSVSKLLGEEMCRAFTAARGIPTVCLRPPAVFTPEEVEKLRARLAAKTRIDRLDWIDRIWLDVRDLARSVLHALTCPDPGHVSLLLSAEDVAGDRPSTELVAASLPSVRWRGGPEYERDPFLSLLDARRARSVLGWAPEQRWPRN